MGNPDKVALIDLAECKWASPCVDLAYFLYSSAAPLMRETEMEGLLGHYHDNLARCLAQLGEDPAVYPFR